MENFNVYDMKIGDSFDFKCEGEELLYTAEKINDYKTDVTWNKSEHNNYGCVTYKNSEVVRYVQNKCWLIIDKPNKQQNLFTKSDLISGEHIVELCNGERSFVAGEYLIDDTGYMPLSDYNEHLQHKNENYTINKVFNGKSGDQRIYATGGLSEYLNNEKLKLIYDRQENEHRVTQEAKLRSLEENIAEQQKAAEKLRQELGL